jgi:hypothetical protein
MPISSDHHVFRVSLDRRIEPEEEWENWCLYGANVEQIMTPDEYDATEYAREIVEELDIPDDVNRFYLAFRMDSSISYYGECDEWVIEDSIKVIHYQ